MTYTNLIQPKLNYKLVSKSKNENFNKSQNQNQKVELKTAQSPNSSHQIRST